MKHNAPLMTDVQSSNQSKNINIGIRRVDFNYKGNNSQKPKSSKFVLSGVEADVNRVLFWLSSKRDDYVRSYLKGGVLYDLIGEITHSSNLTYWKEEITRRFNEEFNGEMILLFIDLNIDKKRRILKVGMVVQDRFLGITFPVNTEAAL